MTSKLFNRIAGGHYLRRFGVHSSLAVSEKGSIQTFDVLSNIHAILDGFSNVTTIFCYVSSCRQIRLMILTLRRLNHQLNSLILNFYPSPENGGPSIFQDLFREVHRIKCTWLQINGTISTYDPLDFDLLNNDYLRTITISESLVRLQPHWLCKFLNSCLILSSILASTADEWSQILPQLNIPSLGAIWFSDNILDKQNPIDIDVLAQFSERHQSLYQLNCGGQFEVISTSKCRVSLPRLQFLKGNVSQLCYFISDSHALPILSTIEISQEDASNNIWDVFALSCTRPILRKIVLPANLPTLQEDLMPGGIPLLRSICPHIHSLQVKEFQSLSRIAQVDFLKWAREMFPGTQSLTVDYLGWGPKAKLQFARLVAVEWPSVKTLGIDFSGEKSVSNYWCTKEALS